MLPARQYHWEVGGANPEPCAELSSTNVWMLKRSSLYFPSSQMFWQTVIFLIGPERCHQHHSDFSNLSGE